MAEELEIPEPQVEQPTDKTKILYDAVSKKYDVGSYDEFSKKLQDPAKRKSFYDGVGHEYELGTYDEFTNKVGAVKKKDTPSPSSGIVSPDILALQGYADKLKSQPQTPLTKVQNKPFNPQTDEATVMDASVVTPANLPKGDQQSYEHKLKVKEGAINTLKKNYAQTGQKFDEKSPNVQKYVKRIADLERDADVGVVDGRDGKPYIVRGAGFGESLVNTTKDSFEAPVKAWDINTTRDPKALADKLDGEMANLPNIPESVPTGVSGGLGSMTGGVVKPAALLSLNALTGGLGTAAMVAEGHFTARANQIRQLYQRGLNEGKDRVTSANEAMHNADLAALPDDLMNIVLAEGGAGNPFKGRTPVIGKMADETFKKYLVNTAEKTAGISAAGGASEGVRGAIEKAQGYDVKLGDTIEKMWDSATEWGKMELGFRIIHGVVNAPKYLQAAAKEYVTNVPKEIRDEYINRLPEQDAAKIKSELGTYDEARKQVEGLVPHEDISTYAGLMENRNALEKSKEGKSKALAAPIDEYIKDIDDRLSRMQKTGKVNEVDDITGEPVEPVKTHDELSKKEREGIIVPKEYGDTEVIEVGEGENKKYKAKATYKKGDGRIMTSHEIEMEGKEYTDKDKAQAAADEALAKHYYENGMAEHDKPLSSKTKTEEPLTTTPSTELKEPTQEQIMQDVNSGKFATFTYGSDSEVPEIFKDKISSRGTTNGKEEIRVTVPQSVADYHLAKEAAKQQTPSTVKSEGLKKEVELSDFHENSKKIINDNPKGSITLYHGSFNEVSPHAESSMYFTPSIAEANDYNVAQSGNKEGEYGHIYKVTIPFKDIEFTHDIDNSVKRNKVLYSPQEKYFRIDNPTKYKIDRVDDKEVMNKYDRPKAELTLNETTQDTKQGTQTIEPTEVPGEIEPPNPPTEPPVVEGSGEGNRVGVSHSSLTELANKLGLGEPKEGEYWEPEHYAERGRILLAAGAEPQDAMNPRNELHDRISIARAHIEDLTKIATAMLKKWGRESTQFKEASRELDDYANNVTKKLGTLAHRAMTSLQGARDLTTDNFVTASRRLKDIQNGNISKEQEVRLQQLTDDNAKLKEQLETGDKKVVESIDEDIKNRASEKEKSDKKTYTEKAKKVADTFRKLKGKEFKFLDENGKEVPISKMGVSWNDLVELGAKAIEKTGEIADGVSAIIYKLKDTDFYKELSDKKKEDLQKQLEGHFQSAVEKTPEYKKIKRLEAELEKLKQGKIKGKPIKLEDSPRAKELKDAIFEEKNKLGLIPSKVKSVAETDYGMEETPEVKNVRRLEKELEDLQQGIAKQTAPSRELTDQEKQLKERIADEKERLGLNKSKQEKPLTEDEQRELSDKKKEDLQKEFVDKSGNKFTIDESKKLWDYAKEEYLNNGVSYIETVKQVSKDTGLSIPQVGSAFESPKTKPMAGAQWKKQHELRIGRIKTEDYIESQERSPLYAAWRKISSVPREIVTALHGHVFMGTHYPMGIATPEDWSKYFPAIKESVKAAYSNKGYAEKLASSIENNKNYTTALRSGLKIDVNDIKTDVYEIPATMLGKKAKSLSEVGTRGFLAMKDMRLKLWNSEWNRLPDSEKTPEVAETLSYIFNVATGATNVQIPTILKEGLFSAPMESARWGRLFKSPAMAADAGIRILNNLRKGEDIKPQDKVFLKVWGKRVGQQLAFYSAGIAAAAALQNRLYPNNKINLTDPSKKDWMKIKIANTTLDISGGIIELAQMLYTLGSVVSQSKSKRNSDEGVGSTIYKYGVGKLSPAVGDIVEASVGYDFNGNPLPFRDKKPTSYGHKLSWGEYLSAKAPIFAEGTIQNIFHGSEEAGLSQTKTEKFLNGVLQFAATAGIGIHAKPSIQYDHSPFTEKDKKDPTFKFFYDKGLELPNTSLSSEDVVDEDKATKKKVSDFPKETQEKYQDEHKKQLKEKLKDILDNDVVYVKTYTKSDGTKENEISLLEKPNSTETSIKKLSKEDLTQVLKLAQTYATKEAKKAVFKQE